MVVSMAERVGFEPTHALRRLVDFESHTCVLISEIVRTINVQFANTYRTDSDTATLFQLSTIIIEETNQSSVAFYILYLRVVETI